MGDDCTGEWRVPDLRGTVCEAIVTWLLKSVRKNETRLEVKRRVWLGGGGSGFGGVSGVAKVQGCRGMVVVGASTAKLTRALINR